MSSLRNEGFQDRGFDVLNRNKLEIATDLKISGKDHSGSLLRNGGLPLTYVKLVGSKKEIIICGEGWGEMIRVRGFLNPHHYFSRREGVRAISFAISHEAVHQLICRLAGRNASLKLDEVSGAGELV